MHTLARLVYDEPIGEQLITVGPHAVSDVSASGGIRQHLVDAVFLAPTLGFGVLALDDDENAFLSVRLTRQPDCDIHRLAVTAELD